MVALHPGVWGRGYAAEAAREVLRYAFDELGPEEVRAATDIPNDASLRLLQRLGFRETRRTAYGPAGTALFALTADEWLASPD